MNFTIKPVEEVLAFKIKRGTYLSILSQCVILKPGECYTNNFPTVEDAKRFMNGLRKLKNRKDYAFLKAYREGSEVYITRKPKPILPR